MPVEIIPARPAHASDIARILFHAFGKISAEHGFPSDVDSLELGGMIAQLVTTRPDFTGFVAIDNGHVIGSNFIMLADEVGGIGPITIDPAHQGRQVGRRLMQAVIDAARAKGFQRLGLLQDSFNTRSLSLYASLGFTVREPAALIDIVPAEDIDPGIRPLTADDLDAADALCVRLQKFSRRNETRAAIDGGFGPLAKLRNGKLCGYLIPGIFGHANAESIADLVALLRNAAAHGGSATKSLIPLRNGDLFRALLTARCRVVKVMNQMTLGDYTPPTGTWLPSIEY